MKTKKSKFEKLSDNTFTSKEMENLKGGEGDNRKETFSWHQTYIGIATDSMTKWDNSGYNGLTMVMTSYNNGPFPGYVF